MLFEGHSSTLL